MRWRLLDAVERLDPWTLAEGRKAVSLEEYSLGEHLGTDARVPETLVLACCCELANWLVARSSDFRRACRLSTAERFRFLGIAGRGDVLRVSVATASRDGNALSLACSVRAGEAEVAQGFLSFELRPLAPGGEAARYALAWRELGGPA